MLEYLYIIGPVAVIASCFWFGPLFLGKHTRGQDAYTALLSPSVRTARNAFERRVALAVREAKHGYFVCDGCGFTNPVRAKACVLCGVAAETKKSGIKALFGGDEDDKSRTVITRPLRPLSSLTSRQFRIRCRKEWVRETRPDGSLVWYHDDQFCDNKLKSFPSYVLQTTVSNPKKLENMVRPSAPDQVEIDIEPQEEVSDTTAAEILTIQQVTEVLQESIHSTSLSAAQVDTGDDASVRTAGISEKATAQRSDTASHADLDFPSKLAQFITTMARLFNESANHDEDDDEVQNKSRFFIDRENLLSDSITAMATITAEQARGAIRVEFTAEQGIDAGGVYREWFLLLNRAIVAPDAGLFVCVDQEEQVFYLNPHSKEVRGENHLAYFLAAGRLLGRALLEGNVTGFHLALPLLKIILGIPVSVSDLRYYDAEAFKNLTWLLENENANALGLDFTVTEKLPDGSTREVELVAGGSHIDVTDDNKRHYVDRKLQYLLFESVSDQLFALLRGLYEIVPAELFLPFDAEELDYMLSGSDEIDVDDWQAHTVTSMELIFHPAYELFWKIVRELDNDELRRLLQFATGSTRVPPGGFGALTSQDGRLSLFTLKGVSPASTLGCLHSHACFNTLDVPLHGFVGSMRTAVRVAITGPRHGFTTA